MLRVLTPPMDQLIAVSKMIEDKLVVEGRTTAPVTRIYNGVDLSRYERVEARAAPSPTSTGWSRVHRSSASWRGSSPRRAIRRSSRRGRWSCGPFQTRTS